MGTPKSFILNGIVLYKASIFGYPHFWKPLFGRILVSKAHEFEIRPQTNFTQIDILVGGLNPSEKY